MILLLAQSFGKKVEVKSYINSAGDLVVTGSDELNRQYFTFGIKTDKQAHEISKDLDDSSIDESIANSRCLDKSDV